MGKSLRRAKRSFDDDFDRPRQRRYVKENRRKLAKLRQQRHKRELSNTDIMIERVEYDR